MAILNLMEFDKCRVTPSSNNIHIVEIDMDTSFPVSILAGYDTDVIIPLINMFAQSNPNEHIYTYQVLNNSKETELTQLISIPHTRSTDFLFTTFKKFGINLNELTIGISFVKGTVKKLYIPNKVLAFCNTSSDTVVASMTNYLLCLACILIQVSVKDTPIGTITTTTSSLTHISVSQKTYETIAAGAEMYDSLCKCIAVNNIELTYLDVNNSYTSVEYHLGVYNMPDVNVALVNQKYVYNRIVLEGREDTPYLAMLNMDIKPVPYIYLLNLKTNTNIYTNQPLLGFIVTDMLSTVSIMAKNICTTEFAKGGHIVRVCYNSIDNLLGFPNNITVTADAEEYVSFLEKYAENVEENFNTSIYETYTKFKVNKTMDALMHTSEYASDAYAQELYKQVLPYYADFNLKDLTPVVKAFSKGVVYSMLFIGESGTGKSTAARVIPARCGIPYIIVNGSTNIEESDFIGTMIPNPCKSKPEDPEFIWKDGCLVTAMKNGYCIIFEEINFARPGILGKLNSLLDEARQIDLPTGEVVKASPNFRFIMTGNVGYEGTNRLNRALVNRVDVCKEFVDLNKTEALDVIKSRTGYMDNTKLNAIYDVYTAIKKYSNEQSLGLVVSLRQLMNICKHGAYYKTAYDAVLNEMINQAFIEDSEHKQFFIKTVLPAFNLAFKI